MNLKQYPKISSHEIPHCHTKTTLVKTGTDKDNRATDGAPIKCNNKTCDLRCGFKETHRIQITNER